MKRLINKFQYARYYNELEATIFTSFMNHLQNVVKAQLRELQNEIVYIATVIDNH